MSAGVEEVQGQQLALGLRRDGPLLDGPPGQVVQRAAPLERQSVVRHVAVERAPEPQAPWSVAHQEPGHPFQGAAVELVLVPEQCFEGALVDRRTEHGGVAHHHPVRRVQPVDLAGHDPLHRLGQVRQGPGPADLGRQCLEEHRVAAAAARERVHRVRGQRVVRHLVPQELERSLEVQQRRPERQAGLSGSGHEAHRMLTSRDEDQPGPVAQLGGHAVQEVGRGVVHQMGVLDHQHRGRRHHPAEQLGDDRLEPRLPELPVQLLRLRGGRYPDVHRDRQQWQPRNQVGRVQRDPVHQSLGDHGCLGTRRHPQDVAQQRAEREVRRGRLVLLAPDADHRHVTDVSQQVRDQA